MAKAPANPDKHRMFTPASPLKWPKLTEIDYGTAEHPKPDGEYNTRQIMTLSDPEVAEFVAKLDKLMERAKEIAEEEFAKLPVKARKELEKKNPSTGGIIANAPYSPIYDEETEEETGDIEFRTKMKAGGVRKKDGKKWSAVPHLFDTKEKPLPKHVQVWGGSVAVVNFDVEPYFVAGTGAYGLQKRLNAAMITELVSAGGQRTASSFGFGKVEGGFDASDIDPPEGADSGADEGTDDDDDNDGDF